MAHEWLTGPAGRSTKDFPSFTSHFTDVTALSDVASAGYPTRDVVAELLSTNPFSDENEPEDVHQPAKTQNNDDDDD